MLNDFISDISSLSFDISSFAGFNFLKHDLNNDITGEILFTKEFVAQELYLLKEKKGNIRKVD